MVNKKFQMKSNLLLYCCIARKWVTSLRGPSQRLCARATRCPIWPVRDLNLRPPTPDTNALPLYQLAGNEIEGKISGSNFTLRSSEHIASSLFSAGKFFGSLHRIRLTAWPKYKKEFSVFFKNIRRTSGSVSNRGPSTFAPATRRSSIWATK